MRFQLPSGCTEKSGRYYAVIRNKWHALSRVSDGETAFWRAYYRLTRSEPNTLAGIMLAYLEHGTGEIGQATAKKYEHAIVRFLIPYCGHMYPDQLHGGHIKQYLELRKKAGAAVAANRERAALSSAINYAMGQGWMTSNPCHGVRRNKERPARRYVEHDELRNAIDRAPEALQHLLGVAYLTGARQTDLRLLRRGAIDGDWIHINESKTGKPRSHQITPAVRYFLDRALARSTSEYVFTTARGLPWGEWALQSAMRRLAPGFTFRQLRPKAETDKPGTLGHVGQMQARYTRRERLKAVK